MRIFMTGTTVSQSNRLRARTTMKKLDVPRGIVEAMDGAGHEVRWGHVEVGQDLVPGDLVWLNAATPLSLASGHALGFLWALRRAVDEGRGIVIFFDDWQFTEVFVNWAFIRRGAGMQFYKRVSGRLLYQAGGDEGTIRDYHDDLLEAAGWINDPESPLWRTAVAVVPKYAGLGSLDVVRDKMPRGVEVLEIDPTPLAMPAIVAAIAEDFPGADVRARGWTLASLFDHSNWVGRQSPTWPVTYYGSRKLKAERLPDEASVARAYGTRWGALAPEYHHAGSGWFRTRYIYAAVMDAVLVAGAGDQRMLGEPYRLSVGDVERMETADLVSTAQAQGDWLWPRLRVGSADFASGVERVLGAAAGRAPKGVGS